MTTTQKIFYGTFGCGQTFPDKSVRIVAERHEDANYAMHATFGPKFCTTYNQDFEDSQFFQPPVMTLVVERIDEYDDRPLVYCAAMHPENLGLDHRPQARLTWDMIEDIAKQASMARVAI